MNNPQFVCFDLNCNGPSLFSASLIKTVHKDCPEHTILSFGQLPSLDDKANLSIAFRKYNQTCHEDIHKLHQRLISLLKAKFTNDFQLNPNELSKEEILGNLDNYKKFYNFHVDPETGKITMELKIKKEDLCKSLMVVKMKAIMNDCVQRLANCNFNGNVLEAKIFRCAEKKYEAIQKDHDTVSLILTGDKTRVYQISFLAGKTKYKIKADLKDNDIFDVGITQCEFDDDVKKINFNKVFCYNRYGKNSLKGKHIAKPNKDLEKFEIFFEFDEEKEEMRIFSEEGFLDLNWKREEKDGNNFSYRFYIETVSKEVEIQRVFD